jgi:hypothetical protein
MSKLADLRKQREALDKEIAKSVKVTFKEQVADLFKARPTLESFSWTQYTPYFNDGEPCVFSASTDYPEITTNEGSWNDNHGEGTTPDGQPLEEKTPRMKEFLDAITDLLVQFEDEDYETMFGEGKVIVSRRKIEVEDYEHD